MYTRFLKDSRRSHLSSSPCKYRSHFEICSIFYCFSEEYGYYLFVIELLCVNMFLLTMHIKNIFVYTRIFSAVMVILIVYLTTDDTVE